MILVWTLRCIALMLLCAGAFAQPISMYLKDPAVRQFLTGIGITIQDQELLNLLLLGINNSFLIGISVALVSGIWGVSIGAWVGISSSGGLKLPIKRLMILVTFLLSILCFYQCYWHFYFYNEFQNHDGHGSGLVWAALGLASGISLIWAISYRGAQPVCIISANVMLNFCIELLQSLPRLFVLASLAVFILPGHISLVFIFSIFSWIRFASVVRNEVLRLKSRTFIEAARILGLSERRIIFGQIIPIIWPVIWNMAIVTFSTAVIAETSLTFLGIGLPHGSYSLGNMFKDGAESREMSAHLLYPAVTLVMLTLSLHSWRLKRDE